MSIQESHYRLHREALKLSADESVQKNPLIREVLDGRGTGVLRMQEIEPNPQPLAQAIC